LAPQKRGPGKLETASAGGVVHLGYIPGKLVTHVR
jgi:hypothetical protein